MGVFVTVVSFKVRKFDGGCFVEETELDTVEREMLE
jgi:hypothetical protein